MLVVPIMDIIAKYLSTSLPPLEITFGRFLFQFLICIFIAVATRQAITFRGDQPFVNYLRGVLMAVASFCFFTAVKYMSVATAISIFFLEPMILTLLAAVILKEKVGIRRIGAILVGLVGAIVILRPSVAEIGIVSLLPVATAVLFAVYLLLNRLTPVTDSLLTIQLSAGLSGSLLLGTCLLVTSLLGIDEYMFVMPSAGQLGLLAMVGFISFATHGLLVAAFQRGSASLLAPLQYVEIVSATLFGYLVFSDFPDKLTWFGISLIVGSGLYIAHRERRQKRLNQVDLSS